MNKLLALKTQLVETFSESSVTESFQELTLTLDKNAVVNAMKTLKTKLGFEQLMDVCAIDYLHYSLSEWETEEATSDGFSRGVDPDQPRKTQWDNGRFAVAYHLLSLKNNCRLRVKVYLNDNELVVPSVVDIYPSANWFEREAFDLMGIIFDGHPDLRRILTDYGFVGHPFRKDFPLIGNVEVRYDADQQRVVYEPVSIEPRILEPKVIRQDNRYLSDEGEVADA